MHMNYSDIIVSRFNHKGDKNPSHLNLLDVLESFKNGKYKDLITKIRAILKEGNLELYSIAKSKLPAITFCGKFENGHKKENLSTYNYLLIIDIDKLGTNAMLYTRNCLQADKYVFAFWESPSQNGFKGLIKLSYDKEFTFEGPHRYHKYAFQCIAEYFEKTYNILLDTSGSDVSRLCFVSHDTNLVVKSECCAFHVNTSRIAPLPLIETNKCTKGKKTSSHIPEYEFDKRHLNPKGKNASEHRVEISKIIKYLNKKNLSITSNYDNWYRVGYAIANTFTSDLGKEYYLKLCRLDGACHDEGESVKMLIYCYDNSKGYINFGTIIHLAQEQGYKRGGSKGG